MSDIKWIKISTSIFDDEKILLIEGLPKADSILVIWFKLLCLAGKINCGGNFVLNDNIPYTIEMLSKIFRRKKSTVENAIKVFQDFGMVEISDDVISISNWAKHQNLEAFEKKKEYMKEYMKEYRSKKSVKPCKTNSKANVSRIDKDIDKDKEKEEELEIKNIKKDIYGEYQNVKLTDNEFSRLINDYGEKETLEAIKYLDEYIEMKGTKYKSHNMALRKWVFDAVKRDKAKAWGQDQKSQTQFQSQSLADKWMNA